MMNMLKMIGFAAPDTSGSQSTPTQNNNAGANPAAAAAGAQTPNAGAKMPATASPLELIALLGLGTLGVGAALRKPRLSE